MLSQSSNMFCRIIIACIVLIPAVFGLDTEVVVLRAVRGRDARLPCGQGKVFLDGPDAYVLWLKNDRDFLYRFPNEETNRRAINLNGVFGTSCDLGGCHDDTSLLLKRVSERDAGIYRCRVHYQASPSVDYVIDVRLVDSPGMPRIIDGAGNEIVKGYVGPYGLGAEFTLTCEVQDDHPDTLVYWRRNGAALERAHATGAGGVMRADVRVRNASRAELNAHYECLAQNADVTDPLSASVVVKMYLPPLSVEIRLSSLDLEAGQPRVVDCVVVGCVPPPSVTWHLGDALLRPTVHKELHEGNYTVSSLTLAPSLRDSGRPLVCRVHNSLLPNTDFDDQVTLNVGYRPTCLTIRDEVIGAMEKEAETVTCMVEASPEPLQFSWTFADSRTLYTSVKKVPGHHHRYSSMLTWLPRPSDAGPLLCRATNSFGKQKQPCSFRVAAGGAPSAPDCVLLRAYPGALRVHCKKGWDGGRQQTVHLELLDAEGTVLHNASDAAGHFRLPSVAEDRNLSAVVYASNSRGRSDARTLHLQAAKPLTASAIAVDVPPSWARWLEVAAGILAVGVGLASVALCIRAVRKKRQDNDSPDLVPRSDGSFHREPDFTLSREDRLLGTTNITVNQLASCQNQYASSPVPACRVLVGCARAAEPCASTQHSFYV